MTTKSPAPTPDTSHTITGRSARPPTVYRPINGSAIFGGMGHILIVLETVYQLRIVA